MYFHPTETHHLLGNRLYVTSFDSATDPEWEKRSITDNETGKELYGAGVRSYSKPIGFILSLLGVASKTHVGGEVFYVNNKSVSKLVLRLKEFEAEEAALPLNQEWGGPSPQNIAAQKLQAIYENHKKSGYDANKVDFLTGQLNAIVGNKDNRLDLGQITKTLLGELEKNYKPQKVDNDK